MEKSIQRKKEIDILRGIAVIFVVFIHIKFPGKIGQIGTNLGGICNSSFFILSGYYAYDNEKSKLVKKAIRSLMLTLGAYFLYCIMYFDSPRVICQGLLEIPLCNIRNCGNLWFAMALVYCYLIYCLVGKIKSVWYICYIIPAYITYMFFREYWSREYNCILVTLTFGIPLFLLGVLFHKNSERLRKIKGNIYIFIFLIGELINFCNFLTPDLEALKILHRLGPVIFSSALFLYSQFNELKKCNLLLNILINIGQKYYVIFFVMQYVTIRFVKLITKGYEFMQWVNPFIVIVFLYVEAAIYCKLKAILNNYLKHKNM